MAGFTMRVPDIVARLRIDSKSGIAQAESEAKAGGSRIGGALAAGITAAGALVAIDKIKDGLKTVVEAASNYQEELNKSNVVFGPQAKDIQAWADQEAVMGLSAQQALQAAGTYGNLFRTLGVGTQQTANMSKNLVNLAADLASFNNTTPDRALAAIQSALVGQSRPIRAFGVNMSVASLKAEALTSGLIHASVSMDKVQAAQLRVNRAQEAANKMDKNAKATAADKANAAAAVTVAENALAATMDGKVPASLDAATKAQAAYNLIMQQTTLAQGDVARSAKTSLVVSLSQMKAAWNNLEIKIGQAFLPTAIKTVRYITETVIPIIQKFTDKVQPLLKGFSDLADKVKGPVLAALKGFWGVLKDIWGVLVNVGQYIKNVVLPIFSGLGDAIKKTLGGTIGQFGRDAIGVFKSVGGELKTALNPSGMGNAFLDHLESGLKRVNDALTKFVQGPLNEFVKAVGANFLHGVQSLADAFVQLLPTLKDMASTFGSTVVDVWKTFGSILTKSVLPAIQSLRDLVLKDVVPVFRDAGKEIVKFAPLVKDLAHVIAADIVPVVMDLANKFVKNLLPVFKEVAGVITKDVLPILRTLADLFINHVLPAVMPVIDKIGTALVNGLRAFADAFVKHVKPALDSLRDYLDKNKEKIGQFIDIVGKIAGVLVDLLGPVLKFILKALGDLAGFLVGSVISAVQYAIQFFKFFYDMGFKLGEGIRWVLDRMSEFADWVPKAWAGVKKAIGDAIEGLVNGAIKKAGELIDWFKNLPNTLYTWITGALHNFGVIGENIVIGLWNGIVGRIEWLKNKIGGWIGGVVTWFRKLLKIESPSKVFREIGDYTAQGMALGMQGGIKHIKKAAGEMGAASIANVGMPGAVGVGGGYRTAGAPVIQGGSSTTYQFGDLILTGSLTENVRQARVLASRTQ